MKDPIINLLLTRNVSDIMSVISEVIKSRRYIESEEFFRWKCSGGYFCE